MFSLPPAPFRSVSKVMAALLGTGLMQMATVKAAVTLADADSYWTFDVANSVADGTTVISSEIKDFSGNNHVATGATNMTWVTVPANGPYGGSAITDLQRGLSLNPFVVGGAPNVGSTIADNISAATFSVANGTVGGSSAIVTRFMWDGNIPLSDDGPVGNYYCLVKNGYNGGGRGFMLGFVGQDANSAKMQYLTAGATVGSTGSATTSFSIQKGVWYDFAMVLNDGGDATTLADNSISFYAYSALYGLQTYSVNSNMYISTTQDSTLLIGSESTGTGTGNNRKTFDGTLDYLAIFDTAMTQSDVLGIFAAPEPSRGLLMMLGFAVMFLRRRK